MHAYINRLTHTHKYIIYNTFCACELTHTYTPSLSNTHKYIPTDFVHVNIHTPTNLFSVTHTHTHTHTQVHPNTHTQVHPNTFYA